MVLSTDNTDTIPWVDPAHLNLVKEVTCKSPTVYNPSGDLHIVALDCGIKFNQIRCLCERGAKVTVVPANHRLESSGMYQALEQDLDQGIFYLHALLLQKI